MTISIPASLKDKYYDIMNNLFLTDNFYSRICKVYYPPLRVPCDNCTTAHLGGVSTNVFQHGGPAPFSNTDCGICGGNGYKEQEVTDTVRLRIYWNKKDWIKVGDSIVAANSDAQIIGKIADLSKVSQANEIILVSEETALEIRMKLNGTPFYHGFGKNQFFVGYLKQC
jgi:hypothetical protein